MGGLIGALIEKLFESLFGAGMDAAGEHTRSRTARKILVAGAVVLTAWIGVASSLLWTSDRHPGTSGLVAYVLAGGPVWFVILPAIAVITVVWLLLPIKGRHSVTFFLVAAIFALTIGELAAYQGPGVSNIGFAGLFSFVASLILTVSGLLLVYGDPPTLDSPLARLSFDYWGRLKHLRALRQYAGQHGWQFVGPTGGHPVFTATGVYDRAHPVTVTSSAKFSTSGAAPVYTLSVKMGSSRDIVAFRISHERPPKKLQGRVLAGMTRGSPGQRKRAIHFYIVPHPDFPVPEGLLAELATVVERGRTYLRAKDFAHATPFGIRYTHLGNPFGLTVRDAQMDPVLAWMRELIALLEPISPGPAPTRAPMRSPTGGAMPGSSLN